MPKTAKQAHRPSRLERDTKKSLGRLAVVAQPVQRIGERTAGMSAMGRLVTGLASFSDAASPHLKALADKERARVATEIETDVVAGRIKSLDDLKGKPEWWTSLANGSLAQKKANDFSSELTEELATRTDADPDAVANARLSTFLDSLPNAEQRMNALAVLGPRVPKLVETQKAVQRKEAQTKIIDTAWEAARGTLQLLSPEHPKYEQFLWAKRQSLMRDLKSGTANFDMRAFNTQWADTLIALAIKNKSLKPLDSAEIADGNGNAFITTTAGEKLFKARETLAAAFKTEDKSALAVALFNQRLVDDARANSWQNPWTDAELAARVAHPKGHPQQLTPARAASLRDTQRKAIEEQNEKMGDMVALVEGGTVSDPTRLYTAVEGLIDAAGSKAGEKLTPEVAAQVRREAYLQSGTIPPPERDRLTSLVMSTSPDNVQRGIAEVEAYMHRASDLTSELLSAPVERRMMVSQTLRFMGVDEDTYMSILRGQHEAGISQARRALTGGSKDFKAYFGKTMKDNFAIDPWGPRGPVMPSNIDEIEGHVYDIAAVIRGAGVIGDDRSAVEQAVKTVKAWMVPAGGPGGPLMLPSKMPVGFGNPSVFKAFRENILAAEARRLGLPAGAADDWVITTDPTNIDRVRIQTSDGVSLGVVDWTSAARRALHELQRDAGEASAGLGEDIAGAARSSVELFKQRKAHPEAPVFEP